MGNASECINMIVKHLKRQGITTKKNYEKKRKIFANEVDSSALKGLQIEKILSHIAENEKMLNGNDGQVNGVAVQNLIGLYNKAIEYYSAFNDEKHLEYLQKLQKMFANEEMQKTMAAKAAEEAKEKSASAASDPREEETKIN